MLAVSDRVAVLRKGEYIGDTDTATASQQSLTDMMVGRAVSLNIDRPLNENQTERLKVEHLTVKNKEGVKMLDDVTFTALGGEILGIAGIAGSGQKELLESISGLQKLEDGSKITYLEPDGKECLLNGMDTTMTVSTMMHGEYGVDDVCLSVLNVVGSEGAHSKLLAPLTDAEIALLRRSANMLKDVIKNLEI